MIRGRLVVGLGLGFGLALLASCNRRTAGLAATVDRLLPKAEVRVIDGVVRVHLSKDAFDALGVQVAQPQVRELLRYSEFAAEAAVLPGNSVSLTVPVSGRLRSEKLVSEGDLVKKGQALFTIEPLLPPEREVPGLVERLALADQRIARERARFQSVADLSSANAELEAATEEAGREELLLRDGAGTEQAVAKARTRLAIATSAVESARRVADLCANTSAAETGPTVARLEITAPFEATVRSVNVASDSNVLAGTVAIELVALKQLMLRVAVPVSEVGSFDATAPGTLPSGSSPGREVPAVSYFPKSDFAAGTVELDFLLDNDDRAVRIGQRLSILVKRKTPPQAFVVPPSAVIFTPDGSALVYVAGGVTTFIQRRVSLDRIEGGFAWILDGVRDGECVVVKSVNEIHGIARAAPRGK